MTEPLHIQGEIVQRSAGDPGDGRTIRIRMVRWDTPAQTPEGYREAFARGAFAGVDPSRVTIESQRHGGTLVGRGISIDEPEDAGYLEARITRTPAGDELLALIDDGVLREASVAYQPIEHSSDGETVVRSRVDLWRVAVVERGVHPGAGVVAVRSRAMGGSEMVETAAAPDAQQDDALIQRAMAPILDRIQGLDTRLDGMVALSQVPALATFPGMDAGSLGELLLRSWDGEGSRLIARALVDQITPDNVAITSNRSFITDAVGIIRASRPAVEAFGGSRSLPESGMNVEWPVAVPPVTEPIAPQGTEKSEIHSVKVSFTSATAAIKTYAGGSDISIQLLRRSSPSYRDLYARTMLGSYAKVTNAAFAAAVVAGAGGSVTYNLATDTDGSAFTAALFEASLDVQVATGQPATFALVARDVFLKLGGWLVRPVNPTNAIGTGNAAGLAVNISGVDIVPDLNLAAGTILVSNRQSAAWLEDGPNVLEATDVPRLGQNVAYWGLGVPAVTIPDAIIALESGVAARTTASKTATAAS